MSAETTKRVFAASVWREGDWYVAQALDADVASQGKSENDALDNLREALELHFEPPVPSATPQRRLIDVEVAALRGHSSPNSDQ